MPPDFTSSRGVSKGPSVGSLPCLHLSLVVAVRAVVIDVLHPDKLLVASILICHLASGGQGSVLPKSQAIGSDKDRGRGVGLGRGRGSSVQAGLSHDLASERPWVARYQGRVDSGPWRLPSLPRKRCRVTWEILLNPKYSAFCKSALDSSVSEK